MNFGDVIDSARRILDNRIDAVERADDRMRAQEARRRKMTPAQKRAYIKLPPRDRDEYLRSIVGDDEE